MFRRRRDDTPIDLMEDWRVSLRHLAANWDQRQMLVDLEIRRLKDEIVTLKGFFAGAPRLSGESDGRDE